MWSSRDSLIFLAGAEAFHTVLHMRFSISDMLPLRWVWGIELTSQLNIVLMIVNALITVGLLYWSSSLSK